MRSVLGGIFSSLVLSCLLHGCGSSSSPEGQSASCSACPPATYTQEQCDSWGAAMSCKSSKLVTVTDALCGGAAKAHQRCELSDCTEIPASGPGCS